MLGIYFETLNNQIRLKWEYFLFLFWTLCIKLEMLENGWLAFFGFFFDWYYLTKSLIPTEFQSITTCAVWTKHIFTMSRTSRLSECLAYFGCWIKCEASTWIFCLWCTVISTGVCRFFLPILIIFAIFGKKSTKYRKKNFLFVSQILLKKIFKIVFLKMLTK